MTHGNSLWMVFQFGFWRVEGYGYNFAAQACDAPPLLRCTTAPRSGTGRDTEHADRERISRLQAI